jgi:hypothetical protein
MTIHHCARRVPEKEARYLTVLVMDRDLLSRLRSPAPRYDRFGSDLIRPSPPVGLMTKLFQGACGPVLWALQGLGLAGLDTEQRQKARTF